MKLFLFKKATMLKDMTGREKERKKKKEMNPFFLFFQFSLTMESGWFSCSSF
jgi:hypothetical protein